eukprot:5548192-Pleurochrysis_carterae.AAC.4
MALEGGRQSGHLWQQASTDFLKNYGITQFWGEPCIFNLKRDGSFLLVIVWIDDLPSAWPFRKICPNYFCYNRLETGDDRGYG